MSAIDQIPLLVPAQPRESSARHTNQVAWFWPSRTNRWTRWHAWAATFMATLGILATFDAWNDIYHLAINDGKMDEEYSHIFLVPVVAAWMVWVRRDRIRYCKPSGTALGFFIVVLGWAMTTIGFYRGTQSLWHGGAVLLVIGCAMSVLGKHMLFRFFPAVAVLIFLIPVPGAIRQEIALPLETWTAQLSQFAFQLVGIPVERHANLLSLHNQPVNIAEACNGLRMVFALILITFAFTFGLPLRNSVRFVLLAASPLVTIFCNVLRILPTAWIYGYWGDDERSRLAMGNAFHMYSGWLMLPISFLMLLGIIKVMRWAMIPVMRYTLAS
jgi:exosortase